MQCYKQEGSSRVSEDDQAILAERQTLYAHDSLRKEANEKLKAAGKHGSFVKLTKGKQQRKRKGKVLPLVIPRWVRHGSEAGGHQGAEAANAKGGKDTEGKQRGGRGFALWTDCGRSSAAVTGAQNTGDRSVVYNDDGAQVESHGMAPDGSVADWLNTVPGGMANEIYVKLVPKFISKPENAAYLSAGVHYEGDIKEGKFKTPATIVDSKTMYAKLNADGRDKFDKEAGINHYANPNVGEAYSMATSIRVESDD